MSANYWKEVFDKYPEAEGVDFVGLMDRPWNVRTVYDTKTKAEMIAGTAYPRSNYLFWKTVNGKKEYIIEEKYKIKPGSRPVHPEHRQLWALRDWGEDELVGVFEDRATAEEMCVAYTEEAAHQDAIDLYQYHHHWDMKRACDEAWKRHSFDFVVEPVSFWTFLPF